MRLRRMHRWSVGLLVTFIALGTLAEHRVARADEAPRVVATIRPLHSLAAGVLAGVTTPYLLIDGPQSPHAFSLRPTGAGQLQRADVVFMVGAGLAPALTDAVIPLARKAQIAELAKAHGVQLLTVRDGEDENHRHGHETEHGHNADHETDPHIWLDPENAKAMVAAIVETMQRTDPQNALRYRANGVALRQRLDALTLDIKAQLAPLKHRPFIVFHDAFQYFEQRFGLAAVSALTSTPESRPGAFRANHIRRRIQELGKVCVFSEPGFQPKLISVLTEGTSARTAILDPLGINISPGLSLYFDMMRKNAQVLADCLNKT
ncbi:MAG: zinc ABC transporter solute-binding protein [Rhodospirillaceae bacterium]|nr:zinc ABC transporter solute-binding protein [Rhodospirillaceae bacterium]